MFCGNPAAVCPLESWLEDGRLQAIAAENNLSETAFLVQESEHFELRWFTPATKVIPYWSSRLNKKKLRARQLSRRGGELFCENLGDRVKIAGRAVTYLEGFIYL